MRAALGAARDMQPRARRHPRRQRGGQRQRGRQRLRAARRADAGADRKARVVRRGDDLRPVGRGVGALDQRHAPRREPQPRARLRQRRQRVSRHQSEGDAGQKALRTGPRRRRWRARGEGGGDRSVVKARGKPRAALQMRRHASAPLRRAAAVQPPARQRQRRFGGGVFGDRAAGRGAVGAQHQRAADGAFKPDVGGGGAKDRRRAVIDREAEFRRRLRRVGLGQRRRQRRRKARGRVAVAPERRDDDVAPRLGADVGVEQIQRGEIGQQGGVALRRDAAQLQVGARGQRDRPVAMRPRRARQPRRLRR